jgi:hypothetical protein
MNRLEHQIERGLRQIGDRATPSSDAWSSILTRIAAQEPDTETEIIMLTEANPQSTRRWVLFVAAAAAVVAIVGATVIAFAVNDTSSDDDQTPAPAAATTLPPATIPAPTTTVAMETVSFTVDSANDIPVTFSRPETWDGIEGWSAVSAEDGANDGVMVLFDSVSNVYTDGCRWTLLDPPVGPSVGDLVTAWANVPELAATAAVDITVDGYAGKQIEFTVPDYTAGQCEGGKFAVYMLDGAVPPGQWAFVPNQHFQMRVLDVDGTRLVIAAIISPTTTPQHQAELDEMLASIQIG